MKPVTYQDIRGELVLSRLGSYLAWREWFQGKGLAMEVKRDTDNSCIRCWDKGKGVELQMINSIEYGVIRCICETIRTQEYLLEFVARLESSHDEKKTLDEFEIWGQGNSRESLKKIKRFFEEWLRWPDVWCLMYGSVGCGKTHILESMANMFRPWALYITVADFERRVFMHMDDGDLNGFIEAVQDVPILLLDDVAAEYGSEFPKAQLRKVLDYRRLMPKEHITVATTNLNPRQLYQYDPRIADRLLDNTIGYTLEFIGVKSWRTQRHGNS